MMDVPVTCRKCGKKAPASEFSVDPVLKMAICRSCANERKISARTATGSQPTVRNTPTEMPKPQSKPMGQTGGLKNTPPAGWDAEDDLIEKAAQKKAYERAESGIGDAPKLEDGRIMNTCKKCKYQYKYDPETDRPNHCPYCGTLSKGVGRI